MYNDFYSMFFVCDYTCASDLCVELRCNVFVDDLCVVWKIIAKILCVCVCVL